MIYFVALKRACCGGWRAYLSLGLLGLLGEKDGLDIGQDTSLGDGDTGQELVQLLIVTDGELKVAGDDPGLLVVTSSVAGQLEDLSGQILHDGGHVDGGAGSDTLGIVTLPQETVDTSHGKLKSSTAGPGLCLSLDFAALASSGHVDCWVGSELLIFRGRGCETLYRLLGAQRCGLYPPPICPGNLDRRARASPLSVFLPEMGRGEGGGKSGTCWGIPLEPLHLINKSAASAQGGQKAFSNAFFGKNSTFYN